MRFRHKSIPLLLLLLLGMALLEVSSLRVKSSTADEGTHLAYGARGLHQGTFDRDDNRFDATMPVSVLNAAVVSLSGWTPELGRRQRLQRARLATVALSLLLCLAVFAWAFELFGPRAGILAAFLCALSPNVLAHGRLVTTDIALTLGFFTATYFFWRYLQVPSRGRLVVAGLAFGVAQLSKITAVFLVFIFLLFIAKRSWPQKASGKGRDTDHQSLMGRMVPDLLALVFLCLSAVVVVNAGFGFEGTFTPLGEYSFQSQRMQDLQQVPLLGPLPLPAPVPFVQGVDLVSVDMARDRWTYCLGEYYTQGVWFYYLVAFALKVPIPMLVFLGLSLGLAARSGWGGAAEFQGPGRASASNPPVDTNSALYLLLPSVFLWVYLSGFYQYQIGLRHLLPVFPFLFVFVSSLAVWSPARWPRLWLWARRGLVVAYAFSALTIYPHFLAYFNPLGGGPDQGWRYLIDSNLDWGQDRAEARFVYAQSSSVPVHIEPRAPVAGRILVSVNRLVGLKPGGAAKYRWLRDNFEPVDHIGHSWKVYDVSLQALQDCCPEVFRPLPDAAGNLAPLGRPIGRSRGHEMESLERLNDQSLGTGAPSDASVSAATATSPVGGWFGIDWEEEQLVDRVRAYPGLFLIGRDSRRFLASDLVVESWSGHDWVEVAGTRVEGNEATLIDLRFEPRETKRIRLRILRARNHKGLSSQNGKFRLACLEFAVFGPAARRESGS